MHRSTGEIPGPPQPAAILQIVFAGGTVLFAVAGFFADEGTKLFAASGACGVLWWGWDLLVGHVLTPIEYWMEDMTVGGALRYEAHNWSLDDRVAMLEDRIVNGQTMRLQIQAAIRLEEIYRLQKKNEQRAREVIEVMKARYPDAPELERFRW
jgi:hypothetical protein